MRICGSQILFALIAGGLATGLAGCASSMTDRSSQHLRPKAGTFRAPTPHYSLPDPPRKRLAKHALPLPAPAPLPKLIYPTPANPDLATRSDADQPAVADAAQPDSDMEPSPPQADLALALPADAKQDTAATPSAVAPFRPTSPGTSGPVTEMAAPPPKDEVAQNPTAPAHVPAEAPVAEAAGTPVAAAQEPKSPDTSGPVTEMVGPTPKDQAAQNPTAQSQSPTDAPVAEAAGDHPVYDPSAEHQATDTLLAVAVIPRTGIEVPIADPRRPADIPSIVFAAPMAAQTATLPNSILAGLPILSTATRLEIAASGQSAARQRANLPYAADGAGRGSATDADWSSFIVAPRLLLPLLMADPARTAVSNPSDVAAADFVLAPAIRSGPRAALNPNAPRRDADPVRAELAMLGPRIANLPTTPRPASRDSALPAGGRGRDTATNAPVVDAQSNRAAPTVIAAIAIEHDGHIGRDPAPLARAGVAAQVGAPDPDAATLRRLPVAMTVSKTQQHVGPQSAASVFPQVFSHGSTIAAALPDARIVLSLTAHAATTPDCAVPCRRTAVGKPAPNETTGPTPAEALAEDAAKAAAENPGWADSLAQLWTTTLHDLGIAGDAADGTAAAADTMTGFKPRRNQVGVPDARVASAAGVLRPVSVLPAFAALLTVPGKSFGSGPEEPDMGAEPHDDVGPNAETPALADVPLAHRDESDAILSGADIDAVPERAATALGPVGPYGVTPDSYDVRGYTLKLKPGNSDNGMWQCNVDLAQGEDGRFTIKTAAGTSVVVMESGDANEAGSLPAPTPAKAGKSKRQPLPMVEAPVFDMQPPVRASFVVEGHNRPLLELKFPSPGISSNGSSVVPYNVVCRYDLEIKPPACRLSTVSHRVLNAAKTITIEQNVVGSCELARTSP